MAKQYKRKKRAVKAKKKPLFTLKFLLICVLLVTAIPIGFGVYLFESGKIVFVQEKKVQKSIKDKDIIEKARKSLNGKTNDILKVNQKKDNKKQKNVIKENKKDDTKKDKIIKKHEDKKDKKKDQNKKITNKDTFLHVKKPKLAIIIDDVSFQGQVKAIDKIPYKVTLSFLPPTKSHPNSAKIARKLPVYMVHLPLEAQAFKKQEQRTLMVGESYKNMEIWIKQLKKWFPKAKYYNNHTGSKFTSDLSSMDKLFRVLKKHNIHFLDSRTSVKTKAQKVAKKHSVKLLSRDVFLDNSKKIKDINKQLKLAVKIAKKYGQAIAICHPYPSTIKALKNAKSMFKGVKLVYVNEL